MSEAPETSVTTGKTHKSLFSKHGLRQVVSQKRVRFQDGIYDLDLSYICQNIIAMGLPAKGMDAMFRNNENDVASMLNRFHPNSYAIYNLAQKKYDYTLFSKVLELGWKDHHAPGLELLFENVNSMCEFLKQDYKNVVIVHCKAGKGRTGTSIAALLVYCGLYRTPEEALKYFSYRRAHTIDPKGGVTIPSQKRYIKYFADILAGTQLPNNNKYKINSISISGVPMYDKKSGAKLIVHVMHDTIREIYNGKKEPIKLEPVVSTQGTFSSPGLQEVELDGDVMLKFSNVGFFNEEVKFRISFNTYMIEGDEIYWVFYRHDLDDAYKDDDVPSQFKLEVRMTKCGEAPAMAPGSMTQWQKALKNRHLYQNMFSKMSYQASTVYDPANNIGDVMEDIPNFLSQPQIVVNGQIVENQSANNSIANMEIWESQQEERFLQEQAMQGSTMIRSNMNPTSGSFNAFTPNPISPRMSSQYQATSSPQSTQPPPPLPRRAKPSLAQWEAYFQQHQATSMGPASILGVMLQLPTGPTITSEPANNVLSSPQPIHLQPPPQPPAQPQTPVVVSLASLSPNNNSAANFQRSQPPFQPPQAVYTPTNNTGGSSLPAPPPPPSTPNPSAMHQQYQHQQATPPQVNVNAGDNLPLPPAPPTPGNAPATQPQQTAYGSFYGNQNSYSQQYQQLQQLQPGQTANAPPPTLPRRPPMMPPGGQPQ